jgi:putative acetyltransferase
MNPRGEVVLRRGTVADAPAIYALSLDALRTSAAEHYTSEQLEAWASLRTLAGHERMLQSTYLLLAEVDGVLSGFANLVVDNGLVDHLFVAPSAGGQGLGRRLLGALEEHARALGLPCLESHASKRAITVFERCGYERLELETVEIDGLTLERFLVRKSLAPS